MGENILDYHRLGVYTRRSRHGSSQKAISAKMDEAVMKEIEAERRTTGVTTNRLINMAVKWYLHQLDEARREAAHGTMGKNPPPMNEEQLVKYILCQLAESDRPRFLNYCKVRKASPLCIVGEAVSRLLDDYDK